MVNNIVIAGGGGPISSSERFDGNVWQSLNANLSIARSHIASFTLNNYGYACTGKTTISVGNSDKYDRLSDVWSPIPNTSAVNSAAGFDLGEYGYVTGGWSTFNTSATRRYNPITNGWTYTSASLNYARYAHCAFSLSGYGYTVGGDAQGFPLTNIMEQYNSTSNIWVVGTITPMPTGRKVAASFILNNYAYICGGYSTISTPIVERYDNVSNSWITSTLGQISSMNNATYAHRGKSMNGYGYVIGTITQQYNDISNSWSNLTNPITPRTGHAISVIDFDAGTCPPILCTLEIIKQGIS